MFTIKEQYNNQNNKIYAETSLQVHSEDAEGHHPSYVMVWWGVSHQGMTPLHFCEKGVKIDANVYQEVVLQGVVKPHNTTIFSGQKWVFQQDSAPAHKAKMTEEWLRRNVPALSAPRIGPQRVQTSIPWTINLGCFGGRGLLKASQQPGQPEEIPHESISRDPPGDGACHDSRVAGASQGLQWGRGQPF